MFNLLPFSPLPHSLSLTVDLSTSESKQGLLDVLGCYMRCLKFLLICRVPLYLFFYPLPCKVSQGLDLLTSSHWCHLTCSSSPAFPDDRSLDPEPCSPSSWIWLHGCVCRFLQREARHAWLSLWRSQTLMVICSIHYFNRGLQTWYSNSFIPALFTSWNTW